MQPKPEQHPDSLIRTRLEKIILQLQGEHQNLSASQVHALARPVIDEAFPDPIERQKAHDINELGVFEQPILSPLDEVWYRVPMSAESALTEFTPIGEPIARSRTSVLYRCKMRFPGITSVVKLVGRVESGIKIDPRIFASLALRELQALVGRRHPNVVSVLDAGHLMVGHDKEGRDLKYPYVAMEYLNGVTLLEWIRNHTPSPQIAAETVAVLADAIAFCHAGNNGEGQVAHGDISPNNAMVCGESPSRETLKLIDFGMADLEGETPGYADPSEGGNDPNRKYLRDVYSLGATLFFCATGQHPPSNVDPKDHTKQRLDHAAWLREHADWVESIRLGDKSFTMICQRALTTKSETRYHSALELQEDLGAWLSNHPLPHARKGDYSIIDPIRMLFERSRDHDDVPDHMRVVALASLLTAFDCAALGVGHVIQVMNGADPATAYFRIVSIVNAIALLIFAGAGYSIRFRRSSMKIFEPLMAMTVGLICLIHFTSPSQYFSFPNWHEFNLQGQCVMLMMGMLQVAFAAWSPEWKMIRWSGWMLVVGAFFARPLFESRLSAYAMPVVLSVVEVIGCLIFARILWSKKVVTPPASH